MCVHTCIHTQINTVKFKVHLSIEMDDVVPEMDGEGLESRLSTSELK